MRGDDRCPHCQGTGYRERLVYRGFRREFERIACKAGKPDWRHNSVPLNKIWRGNED